MGTTFVVDTELTTMNCGQCGGTYAIQERYRAQKHKEGGGWHCPYCQCSWGYYKNNENSRLKSQIKEYQRVNEQERQRRRAAEDQAITAERRRRGEKAAKTRIKNRVANGVCPCCNRTFKNLHEHMKNQHPDYANQD